MRESNRLLRESNPRRSFGDGSQQKFAVCSSRILEQFSRMIEAYMETPPNTGEGCRVQPPHIENCFTILYQCINQLIEMREALEDE
jgi:hypothetical protein